MSMAPSLVALPPSRSIEEFFAFVDVLDVEVQVSHGDAGGVGRRELGQGEWRQGEDEREQLHRLDNEFITG